MEGGRGRERERQRGSERERYREGERGMGKRQEWMERQGW